MKDRTIKTKHPWNRFFTIGNPELLDDLAISQIEAKLQIKEIYKSGKGSKRNVVK